MVEYVEYSTARRTWSRDLGPEVWFSGRLGYHWNDKNVAEDVCRKKDLSACKVAVIGMRRDAHWIPKGLGELLRNATHTGAHTHKPDEHEP